MPDETYTYDNVGNRTTASNATGGITHNTNNELLGYGDTAYTYDANGNLTQKKVGAAAMNYIYNAENRLVKVEDDLTKTVMAEYGYDPFGRRLWKEVNGVRTYFLYADEGLVAEYDTNGNELRSYGYQPDSTWGTDPLWLKQGGQYYWYQNDHLGTPQKLVAMNGAVVWAAVYSAFGKAEVQVETVKNNLRFPGQYFDAETGLHYNFQRYYEPGSGRYVSADPIGLAGGINLYGYARNNPRNITDSLGLQYAYPRDYNDIIFNDPMINQLAQSLPKPLPNYNPLLKTIPIIMRTKQWDIAAQLLEQWFNLPAGNRDRNPPDTTTIKMAWVLQWPRAREKYNEILANQTYATPKALSNIYEDVLPRYYQGDLRIKFGDFSKPVPELEKEYVRQASVAYGYFDLYPDSDPLIAALGQFNFHVVVQGEAVVHPNANVCVRIDAVGIYVKDSFDFEDNPLSVKPTTWFSQPLGFWNESVPFIGPYGGMLPLSFIYADNEAFRQYRSATGQGGDYLIFSDLKVEKLDPPV